MTELIPYVMVFKERVGLKTLGAFLGGSLGVEFDFIMIVEGFLLNIGEFFGRFYVIHGVHYELVELF